LDVKYKKEVCRLKLLIIVKRLIYRIYKWIFWKIEGNDDWNNKGIINKNF
jgi:hypothetical protein